MDGEASDRDNVGIFVPLLHGLGCKSRRVCRVAGYMSAVGVATAGGVKFLNLKI